MRDKYFFSSFSLSHGEDWQPLTLYRNSLVHGEGEIPVVTSKRPYTRKRKANDDDDDDDDDEDYQTSFATNDFLTSYETIKSKISQCGITKKISCIERSMYLRICLNVFFSFRSLILSVHIKYVPA